MRREGGEERRERREGVRREERGVRNESCLQSIFAFHPAFQPDIPAFFPVIPAKAGIQRFEAKFAIRNQVRIASDKSLPHL